jgi:hypothetical protein
MRISHEISKTLELLFLGMILAGTFPSFAQTYTTFDPAGSIATHPQAINTAGEIVGFYYASTNVSYGFIRKPDGTFIAPLDPGGAADVRPNGVNAEGIVVGSYRDKAFLRSPDGAFSTLHFPKTDGASYANGASINDAGLVGETTSKRRTAPVEVSSGAWMVRSRSSPFPEPPKS